ncbi:MAG: DUF2799 domain-containing protein [Burkholderiaceae bacterium]
MFRYSFPMAFRRCGLLVLFACLSFLATSCAQISKEECTTGDWRAKGLEDGQRGFVKLAKFNQYSGVCQKEHGIALNSEPYFAGYDEGLPLFCTESNGRALGGKGVKYQGVCTPEWEPRFMLGYEKGLEGYCTAGNGARLGGRAAQYHGVCPQALQKDFLAGFVPGLEASLSKLDSDLFYHRRELSRLESTHAREDAELRHQRSELARTRKHTPEYRERKRIISRIKSQNFRLESDIRSAETALSQLEKRHGRARQQLSTWRPLMHE